MTRPRLLPLLLVLAVGISARGRVAFADEDLAALLAEPLESTAGKGAGTAAAAPALSISVSAEDLRRHGIHTLAEAYNFLTLGLVSETPLGEPEVGSRGLMFSGDLNKHVLLLIDGHSTNNQEDGASFHGAALGMAIELIDHVEVVLGPGSVLYGSNAMLGVINVVTKSAKDYSGVHVVATGAFSPPINRAHSLVTPALTSQYLRNVGESYRYAIGGGREFVLRGVPAELTAQLQYETSDGPTTEWGPQLRPNINYGPASPRGVWGGLARHSFYERVSSGYARLVWGRFEIALHLVASRVSQPALLRVDQPPDSDFDDPDSAKVQRLAGLDLKWFHNFSTVASFQARLYSDWITDSFRVHDHSYIGCLDHQPEVFCAHTQAGYARWAGTELQGTLDWPGSVSMTTLLGTDARLRKVGFETGSTAVDTGQSVVYGSFGDTQAVGAVYAQHVYRPARWLTVNGGVRWDLDSRYGNRILPRAAVITEPWSGGTLKVIYSQAFRPPTTDEVNFRDPLFALASPGLRPESVRSVEAILEQRFGSHHLVFGVFRSWWSDMIVRHQLKSLQFQIPDADSQLIAASKRAGDLDPSAILVYQYRNVATIENFGLNGGFDGTVAGGRLAYGLNLTAGYARLNTPEGAFRPTVTPSMFGNARVAYDLSNRLPVLALAAHFSDRRLSDAGELAGFQPLPYAPASLDLRGSVAGPLPMVKRLSYQVVGTYAFAPSSPYTAGPNSVTPAYQPLPELMPTVRFTILFGLELNLN